MACRCFTNRERSANLASQKNGSVVVVVVVVDSIVVVTDSMVATADRDSQAVVPDVRTIANNELSQKLVGVLAFSKSIYERSIELAESLATCYSATKDTTTSAFVVVAVALVALVVVVELLLLSSAS